MGFDRKGSYSIDDEVDRNVVIFGVDMSSSPDVVKNINIKAFNLMSRTNEKRHIK